MSGATEQAKAAEQARQSLQEKAGAALKKGYGAAPKADAKFDIAQGMTPGAAGQKVGDSFQYVIQQPVSVPRQKSSLLPLINQHVGQDDCKLCVTSLQA